MSLQNEVKASLKELQAPSKLVGNAEEEEEEIRSSQSRASQDEQHQQAKLIEQWKIRKLIQKLEMCHGNHTSLISLVLPPNTQISKTQQMLSGELHSANSIKSRTNRLSVLGALRSIQERLKRYKSVPDNGLFVYCGTVVNDDGSERKMILDFVPPKPVTRSRYVCGDHFDTELLAWLAEDSEKFGFIVMDGSCCLFGTLSGSHKRILHEVHVELPKKHGRGGQSSVRFARIRTERRHNYLRKVAELAVSMFIENDRPNVAGLILAGSAEFKKRLFDSDLLDPRLKVIVQKIVEVAYSGENGFHQAIELSQDTLKSVRFLKERELLRTFFEDVAKDSGKICYGVDQCLAALQGGLVETLLVWEELPITRYELRNPATQESSVRFVNSQEERKYKFGSAKTFHDPRTQAPLDVVSKSSLLEWLVQVYASTGAKLELVTDQSPEGSQFCRGFGGVGAFCHYRVNVDELTGEGGADSQGGADGDGESKEKAEAEEEEDEFF